METPSSSQKHRGFSEVDKTNKKQVKWELLKNYLDAIYKGSPDENKRERYANMRTYFAFFDHRDAGYVWKPPNPISVITGGYPKTFYEFYFHLKKYLQEFLSGQLMAGGELEAEEFLQFYTNLWKKYRHSSKVLDDYLDYYNENYIKQMMIYEPAEDFVEAYRLALIAWKETVFDKLNEDVTRAVVDLIEKERRGEMVDTSSIFGAIESYVELGLLEKEKGFTLAHPTTEKINWEELHLTVYQKYFEKYFWMTTESFYVKEAIEFLKENTDLNECTQKMEKRFEEEQKRVELYLHQSTGERISRSFQVVFRIISDSCFGWNNFLHKFEKI